MLTYRSKFFGGGTSGGSGPITVTGPIQATTLRATAPAAITITGATNATPIVVTAVGHGLVTGDNVSISGITGNTNANGYFKVTRLTADTFSLQNYSTGADIAGNGAYGGSPVAVTGIVQASRVLVAGGSDAAAPQFASATDPRAGMRISDVYQFHFTRAAGVYASIYAGGYRLEDGDGAVAWSGRGTLTSPAAATLQLGAPNAASPVAQTLQAQGGSGTDVAGANLTIRPGAGTGAATGASLIFQTPTATGSGTGAQTMTTRLTLTSAEISAALSINPSATDSKELGSSARLWQNVYFSRAALGSKSKALTDGSPVTFATFAIADGAMYSGEVIYNVKAVKGTDVQVLANKARFTAARVGTTYYVSVAAIGSDVASVSTGTLTCPISISGTGGVISLVATADTSFASPDSLVGQFRFDSPDAALALTFP